MKIYDFEQRSPEWFKARCGIPTASNFHKIITATGKPSSQAKKYLYKVAGEAVTGSPEDTYQSAAMLRGCEMESEAKSFYEVVKGIEIEEVGFCTDKGAGCSPDGLIGKDGMIEVKCPIIATQVGYLVCWVLPADYVQQVQGQLLVTGRKWCEFVSYYPGLKPLIIRVERDEKFIAALKSELEKFCAELKEIIIKIK